MNNLSSLTRSLKLRACILALGTMALIARADVLIATNGERFVGTVIAVTTHRVVFESELGGQLTLSPEQILRLDQTAPVETNTPTVSAAVSTNAPASNASNSLAWLPPGIGHDGFDWLQFKSGEWLKGTLKYIQQKKVEFDSDELEEMTLKLKDIRQVYTAHPVFVKFNDLETGYGTVVLSNGIVTVYGAKPFSMPREELSGITPGGESEFSLWSGDAVLGINFQSGNTRQTTLNASAELGRRTPNTALLLDYLGNYSEVNDSRTANNHRGNVNYDIRLNRDWFVRPVLLEFYHDPIANISLRTTAGAGAGYYFFDRDDLEWTVGVGPSYQYTRFNTVEPGESDSATTPAGVVSSRFKVDLTSRLTFYQNWQSMFMDREAGQYTHHTVSTLEFEIKRHLDLDVSFIWDYLKNPQMRSDGTTPDQNDYYMTVGFGVRF